MTVLQGVNNGAPVALLHRPGARQTRLPNLMQWYATTEREHIGGGTLPTTPPHPFAVPCDRARYLRHLGAAFFPSKLLTLTVQI